MILRVPFLIPFPGLVTSSERCRVISGKRRSSTPWLYFAKYIITPAVHLITDYRKLPGVAVALTFPGHDPRAVRLFRGETERPLSRGVSCESRMVSEWSR
jgi:hypothetical protein